MSAAANLPARVPLSAMADADTIAARDAAAGALDCLRRGLIVADERCAVLFANRTAERMLQERDGLIIQADGLHAARPQDSSGLRARIRQAARPGADPASVSVLSLWRPSLKRVLLARVAPVMLTPTPMAPSISRAAVFLQDPAARPSIDEWALSRLFGLTRSESHLVGLLLNGMSLQEASAVQGITLNTARTHLKHVFLKTDTNRQTQLIAILIGSVLQAPELS